MISPPVSVWTVRGGTTRRNVEVSFVSIEQADFIETMRASAPGTPTLCPPWTVRDMAAHLVLRERSLSYAMSIERGNPQRKAKAEQRQREFAAAHSFEELIERFESGPPPWMPFSWPGVRGIVNLLEYVVHHEDVRRSGTDWEPRSLPLDRQRAVWVRLRGAARTFMRPAVAGMELRWDGSPEKPIVGKASDRPVVVVVGDPVEVALVVFGRARVSRALTDGSSTLAH
jgi:uncharacterized protein (TIGR03085 family)